MRVGKYASSTSAGKKRYATANTLFLVHRGIASIRSESNDIRNNLERWEEKEQIRNNILFVKSKISLEKQPKFLSFENQFDTKKALEYGLIDEIL